MYIVFTLILTLLALVSLLPDCPYCPCLTMSSSRISSLDQLRGLINKSNHNADVSYPDRSNDMMEIKQRLSVMEKKIDQILMMMQSMNSARMENYNPYDAVQRELYTTVLPSAPKKWA